MTRQARLLSLLVFLTCFCFAQRVSPTKISEVPDGSVSDHTYVNDVLGVTLEFPAGWKSDLGSGGFVIDPRGRDKKANRCSKILLTLTSPRHTGTTFDGFAALFVSDPLCLAVPGFPRAADPKELKKFASKVVDVFSHSVFISPYGAEAVFSSMEGRPRVQLSGGLVINALAHPAPRKEPLELTTTLSITPHADYWVVWAYSASDASTVELKSAKMRFGSGPPAAGSPE